MIRVTYVADDDSERIVETQPGMTLMEVASLQGIPGIVAECGGSCSCATCHVYVDEEWAETFEEPAPEEEALLEFLEQVRPCSRLSCQLLLTEQHDGVRVQTPELQA